VDPAHDRILDAAARLFAEDGARGATTRRIAALAGVNEVTIFRHFASKEELLMQALDRTTAERITELSTQRLPAEPVSVPAELSVRLREVHAGFTFANRSVRTALGEWGHHPELDERLLRVPRYLADELEQYIAAAQARGLVRGDVLPAVAAQALLALVFADGLLRPMLPAHFPLEPGATVDAYLTIILDGLLPSQPGRERA
jgi:AcrR family transcriptional regulator